MRFSDYVIMRSKEDREFKKLNRYGMITLDPEYIQRRFHEEGTALQGDGSARYSFSEFHPLDDRNHFCLEDEDHILFEFPFFSIANWEVLERDSSEKEPDYRLRA